MHHPAAPVRLRILAVITIAVLLAIIGAWPVSARGGAARPQVAYTLTLLHNNDGESNLLADADGSGGIARFATLVDRERRAATGQQAMSGRRGVLVVSSGDNFLAGPEWNASLAKGAPFYDSIALDAIGYDAMTIGNHEFDFGPDVLADFISGFSAAVPFISANLDVSEVDSLAALADAGQLTSSTVVRERSERIGIVGATTPLLESISSPGDVVVEAVLPAVQAEVDRLTADGVEIIVLSSHLQSIDEELALVPQLRDVDIVIAGGGDENLGESYPLAAQDADGDLVYVITTPGDYAFLGKLVVGFDAAGEPVAAHDSSGLVAVTADLPPDRFIQRNVVEPVTEYVSELAATVVADTAVNLNGLRGDVCSNAGRDSQDNPCTPGEILTPGVRNSETNEGNLMADALRDTAMRRADVYGLPGADVALQNGGGIRNNSVIPAGELTRLDTFDIAPFSNFVAVIPDVSRERLAEVLEHSVAIVGGGQFGQWSGIEYTYDASQPAGSRIVDASITSGATDVVIVEDGAVVDGPAVTLATIDFLATGGDGYPLDDLEYTRVGVTYQQALETYLSHTLDGQVTVAQYPEGGSRRITRL